MDTLGRFSALFTRETTSALFTRETTFITLYPSEKSSTLKGKNLFASKGNRFLPSRLDPFPEGTQNM